MHHLDAKLRKTWIKDEREAGLGDSGNRRKTRNVVSYEKWVMHIRFVDGPRRKWEQKICLASTKNCHEDTSTS